MPNIQFHTSAGLYFEHKKLPLKEKRELNDKLRKTFQREHKKYPEK